MGRASLRQLARERLTSTGAILDDIKQPRSRLELIRLCFDAIKATFQLILILKKHNMLYRFSFTGRSALTAVLTILILYRISQHGVHTISAVDDWVELLRSMAHVGCTGYRLDAKFKIPRMTRRKHLP